MSEVKYMVEYHYVSQWSDVWLPDGRGYSDTIDQAESRWIECGNFAPYRIVEIRTVRTVVKESE